jgi:hypothetical protein
MMGILRCACSALLDTWSERSRGQCAGCSNKARPQACPCCGQPIPVLARSEAPASWAEDWNCQEDAIYDPQ